MKSNSKMYRYHIEDCVDYDDEEDDFFDDMLDYIKTLSQEEKQDYNMRILQGFGSREIQEMDFEVFKKLFSNNKMLLTNPKVLAIMYGVSKTVKRHCLQPHVNITQNANSQKFSSDFPIVTTSGYVDIRCLSFELKSRNKVKKFMDVLEVCGNFWETTMHTDGTINLNFDFKNANIIIGETDI